MPPACRAAPSPHSISTIQLSVGTAEATCPKVATGSTPCFCGSSGRLSRRRVTAWHKSRLSNALEDLGVPLQYCASVPKLDCIIVPSSKQNGNSGGCGHATGGNVSCARSSMRETKWLWTSRSVDIFVKQQFVFSFPVPGAMPAQTLRIRAHRHEPFTISSQSIRWRLILSAHRAHSRKYKQSLVACSTANSSAAFHWPSLRVSRIDSHEVWWPFRPRLVRIWP